MRVWAILVSAVLGAVAGFVGYFLYFFTPSFPSTEWTIMIVGALIGVLVASVGMHNLRESDAEFDDDTPWPGTMRRPDA